MISPDSQLAAQPENYAQTLLIHSFSLALVFTLIYIPLLGFFTFKAVNNPTYVLWITAFFCQVRVVAFAMRAVLAKVESAGENFNLVLAQQIIYGVGFFGILYSAYIMVLDRELIKGTAGSSPLSRITGNRVLIRIALIAAVSLSITGAVQASTGSTQKTIDLGKHLKMIAIAIFLVVAALLVVHTIFSISAESRKTSDDKEYSSLAPYGLYILLIIGLLLLVREVFYIATVNKTIQYKEGLFYPFAACTELAAVMLFLIPGIIPLKREVTEATREY
jgi:cytochrome b561